MGKRKLISLISGIALIFAMIGSSPTFAQASSAPPLPVLIYGNVVTASGSPITSGTVTAYLNNSANGSISINLDGTFGGPGLDSKLQVNGTISDNGSPITFKVNGSSAVSSPAVSFGESQPVDVSLTVSASVPVLSLPSATLPGGTVGTSYSYIIAAAGGNAPYSYAVTTGNLLGGLTLGASSGAISGTPTTAGTASFTVTVTDSTQAQAAQAFSLAVAASSSSSSGGGGGIVVYTPTVQTAAASSITANSVVLNGDITSDNGYDVTDYGFLWGTSSSSLTNKLDIGTNNQSGAFTDTLSSLTAGTTYYFEAYATNSYGTSDGTVLSFTAGATTTTPTTPSTPSSTAPVFSDVSASYWGYDAISSLSSKGIVSGYPDGTFKPNADITRAEFATMLVKALGLNTTGTTGQFTDVTADAWYYGSVNAAASAGLVSGTGNNLFAPNSLITREQMAVMVAKALGNNAPITVGTELNAFSDSSSVSSWAVSGMEEAVKAGIISGMTADTLAPQADATRAQAAVMIYKMLAV